MNFWKSSAVQTTGSIMAPLTKRRTSSRAMMLSGFTMASVSRLLTKATGKTLCARMACSGTSPSTRGSSCRRARFMYSMPTCSLACWRRSARMVVSETPIFGCSSSKARKSSFLRMAPVVGAAEKNEEVGGGGRARDRRGGAGLPGKERHLPEAGPGAELGQQELDAGGGVLLAHFALAGGDEKHGVARRPLAHHVVAGGEVAPLQPPDDGVAFLGGEQAEELDALQEVLGLARRRRRLRLGPPGSRVLAVRMNVPRGVFRFSPRPRQARHYSPERALRPRGTSLRTSFLGGGRGILPGQRC